MILSFLSESDRFGCVPHCLYLVVIRLSCSTKNICWFNQLFASMFDVTKYVSSFYQNVHTPTQTVSQASAHISLKKMHLPFECELCTDEACA